MASPQLARQLRTLLLIDSVYQERERHIKSKDVELSMKGLTLAQQSEEMDKTLRTQYAFELSLIEDYANNTHKMAYEKILSEMQLRNQQGRKIPKALQKRHDKIKLFAEMPVDQYAIAMMAMPAGQRRLREMYPALVKAQSAQIKEQSKHEKYQLYSPYARHIYATIDVFNKQFPSLASDLANMVSNPAANDVVKKISISALHQLGKTPYLSAQNIQEYDKTFNSQSIAAILATPSARKLSNKIAGVFSQIFNRPSLSAAVEHVKNYVSEKTVSARNAALALGVGLLCIPSMMMNFDNANPNLSDTQVLEHVAQHIDSTPLGFAGDTLVLSSPLLTDDVGAPTQSVVNEMLEPVSSDEPVFSVAPQNQEPEAPDFDADIDNRIVLEPVDGVDYQEPLPEGGDYIVQPGDTLSEIVERQLSNAETSYDIDDITQLYTAVAEHNHIDPDIIKPGQVIFLLSVEEDAVKFMPHRDHNKPSTPAPFRSEMSDDQDEPRNSPSSPRMR